MGDVSTEPTMEEILSSIKRVIEESEASAPAPRARRPAVRTAPPPPAVDSDDEVLELNEPAPMTTTERAPDPAPFEAPTVELRAEPILSASTAEASRGALEALSRLVVKPEVGGADTLEGLVREMLRPMLREWLDAQLPGIVEAMVSKEIARISGRGL